MTTPSPSPVSSEKQSCVLMLPASAAAKALGGLVCEVIRMGLWVKSAALWASTWGDLNAVGVYFPFFPRGHLTFLAPEQESNLPPITRNATPFITHPRAWARAQAPPRCPGGVLPRGSAAKPPASSSSCSGQLLPHNTSYSPSAVAPSTCSSGGSGLLPAFLYFTVHFRIGF